MYYSNHALPPTNYKSFFRSLFFYILALALVSPFKGNLLLNGYNIIDRHHQQQITALEKKIAAETTQRDAVDPDMTKLRANDNSTISCVSYQASNSAHIIDTLETQNLVITNGRTTTIFGQHIADQIKDFNHNEELRRACALNLSQDEVQTSQHDIKSQMDSIIKSDQRKLDYMRSSFL